MVEAVFDVTVMFESAFASGTSSAEVGVYNTDWVVAFEPAEEELEEAKDEVAPAPAAPEEALDCR